MNLLFIEFLALIVVHGDDDVIGKRSVLPLRMTPPGMDMLKTNMHEYSLYICVPDSLWRTIKLLKELFNLTHVGTLYINVGT